MVLVLQSKDTDWWTGLKYKIQPFVTYKKCTSLIKTKNKPKVKGLKKVFEASKTGYTPQTRL
jgi:hypothetical protein